MTTNNFFRMAMICCVMAIAVSCKSKDDKSAINPPTSAIFQQVLNDALKDIIQTKTFKAEDGIDFITEGGVRFVIYPYQLCATTGDVTLEFAELYNRGDMLVVNKPLMGTNYNGDKGPMITGGQFYVNITQNGETIDCGYYSMTVPSENTGAVNNNMTLWEGIEDEDGNMLWNEGKEGQEFAAWARGSDYEVFCGHFGWINIDILAALPDPKTQVWVEVPVGYDGKNCIVYVIYKDKTGSLAYMDEWNPTRKMFTEHYGLAPVGFNFYVVFTSVQEDGKYIYAYKDVTVKADTPVVFKKDDLKVTTKNALVTLINNLK